jgi:D-hydroxyproline dehydrogenase subunit gamma
MICIRVNGIEVNIPAGGSLAAALMKMGMGFGGAPHQGDPTGRARTPLCGMGVCQECRVRVNGVSGRRACLLDVEDAMEVETHG